MTTQISDLKYPPFKDLPPKVDQQEKYKMISLPECRLEGIDTVSDPLISLINKAQKEIIMATYKIQKQKLPQKEMLDALERATKRDVKVFLMTEDHLTEMEVREDNANDVGAKEAYTSRGVKTYSSQNFWQAHQKYIVVDRIKALVGTTNFDKDPETFDGKHRPSRDFSIKLYNVEVIQELLEVFWCDVENQQATARPESPLLWGPEGQRERFAHMLASAEKTLRIYQQDLTDQGIKDLLLDRLNSGVHIEVLMSFHPFGYEKPDNNTPNQTELAKAKALVYRTHKITVHAKVALVDQACVYVGSTNFYQPAIDDSRTMGILVSDPSIINEIQGKFDQDIQDADLMQI